MRVYRGRASELQADRAATARIVEHVRTSGEPAVRVWRPHRHMAFGPRDVRAEGYQRARTLAQDHGFPTVEREVGGRAVACTAGTLAVTRVTPVEASRTGVQSRYERTMRALRSALAARGVTARPGEPADSFCPGSHSLQITVAGADRKLAGLAQRVRDDVAVVGGVLIVRDHETVADILDDVYAALAVSFDPSTVGSVALASDERTDDDPQEDDLRDAVESALVGERPTAVERIPAG